MSRKRSAFLSLRKLEPAKRAVERPSAALVLADDPAATKIASVWPSLPKTVDEDDQLGIRSEHDPETVIGYYWTVVRFDLERLAELVSLPRFLVEAKFELLRAQRLIFPDGTLARAVRELLEAEVRFAPYDRTTASFRFGIGAGRKAPKREE